MKLLPTLEQINEELLSRKKQQPLLCRASERADNNLWVALLSEAARSREMEITVARIEEKLDLLLDGRALKP